MPIVNGTITISFTSNYAGTHTITYTIVNGTPASGTLTVTCGVGPCQAYIPVTYNCPDCEILTIEGTILADCSDDPEDATPFGPKDFYLDQGCRNYKIECLGNAGCPPLVTGNICPECPEWNNIVCAGTADGVTNGDIWGSFVNDTGLPTLVNTAASILKGQVFNLCYNADGVSSLNSYINSLPAAYNLPPSSTTYVVSENPVDHCCWDCETITFTFDPALITPGNTNPALGPVYIDGVTPYPTIYYTSCAESRECADPGSLAVKCFQARHWTFNKKDINSVTLCLRVGSWSIAYANGSYYTVTPNPTLPCGAPPQYTCD